MSKSKSHPCTHPVTAQRVIKEDDNVTVECAKCSKEAWKKAKRD